MSTVHGCTSVFCDAVEVVYIRACRAHARCGAYEAQFLVGMIINLSKCGPIGLGCSCCIVCQPCAWQACHVQSIGHRMEGLVVLMVPAEVEKWGRVQLAKSFLNYSESG